MHINRRWAKEKKRQTNKCAVSYASVTKWPRHIHVDPLTALPCRGFLLLRKPPSDPSQQHAASSWQFPCQFPCQFPGQTSESRKPTWVLLKTTTTKNASVVLCTSQFSWVNVSPDPEPIKNKTKQKKKHAERKPQVRIKTYCTWSPVFLRAPPHCRYPKTGFRSNRSLAGQGGVIYTPHAPNPAGTKHTLHVIILCY